MRITINYCKTTFLATKQFFNTFIQMYSQKFTAPLKKEVSISKVTFTSCLKPVKIKKQLESSMGKNPANYETIRKKNIYEQKPVNIDDFNESEEAEVKQRVEKRKEKRRAVAEKNKLLRKKRKTEKNKIKEKDMWERLGKLNSEFEDIKKAKKESKKTSETIMN